MRVFYKRYVDDTLTKMPDVSSASEFLLTLNEIHPSLSFIMELEDNGKLPFLGMVIIRNGPRLDMKVYWNRPILGIYCITKAMLT